MSYTNGLDKPTDYFNTKIFTGNNSANNSITGIGFQPDWIWFKNRNAANDHALVDSVRGRKALSSNNTSAELTLNADKDFQSFDSDGFTVDVVEQLNSFNKSGDSIVTWNWLAGGTAPTQTYTVKVVSDSGNKYRFDDFGTSAVTLDLQEGGTYTFDQSDSSNSGHPLRFSTTSDGTHGGGSEYTTNVTTTGTPGSAGAKTVITVASGTATLYYYCSVHSGMGGQANTNSTFGSSNFSGSIQANVSANTTAGFSIVSYTGTGSNATVGHGLGVAPSVVITKNLSTATNWPFLHTSYTSGAGALDESTAFTGSFTDYFNAVPTSSVVNIGTTNGANKSGDDIIMYAFAEKKGYSKFGSYTGNGNNDGVFIYTGFKPAWVTQKKASGTSDWVIYDNKRDVSNVVTQELKANSSGAENSFTNIDILSNGFKQRADYAYTNNSGATYIYMAFAENPFVTSTGIPTTAR